MSLEQNQGQGQDFVAPHTGGEKPKRRWWPFGRREEVTPVEPVAETPTDQNDDPDAENDDLTPHESVETEETEEKLPEWQKLQFTIQESDAAEWRKMELDKVYTKERTANFNAFMDGERDFEVDEDGQIRRDGMSGLKETGRKMLASLVNKKNLGGAVALAGVAIATGGVGIPAIMTLAGGVVGRGVVEAWHSINGKERKLREERAIMSYEQFQGLTERANAIDEEGISEEEKLIRIETMVTYYNETNKILGAKTAEILQLKDNWNRKRNIGQFLGSISGGVTGVVQNWANLSEKAMTMHLDGIKNLTNVAHHVEKVNGVWSYIYNSSQEAAKAYQMGAHQITQISQGVYAHALGETGLRVAAESAKNWLTGQAGHALAVFAGMAVGRFFDRNDMKKESANLTESSAEEVVEMPEPSAPTAEPEVEPSVATAESGPVAPVTPSVENSGGGGGGSPEAGESMPVAGEIWQYNTGNNLVLVKVESVDPGAGTLEIRQLDENRNVINPDEPALKTLLNSFLIDAKRFGESEPVVVSQQPEVSTESTSPTNEPLEVTEEDLEEPERLVVEEEAVKVENRESEPIVGQKFKLIDRDKLPRELKKNFPSFFTFTGYGEGKLTMAFKYKFKGEEKTRNIMTEKWPEIAQASQLM